MATAPAPGSDGTSDATWTTPYAPRPTSLPASNAPVAAASSVARSSTASAATTALAAASSSAALEAASAAALAAASSDATLAASVTAASAALAFATTAWTAVAALTNFTVRQGDGLVDEWVELFGELFVRFSDGLDATQLPRAPAPPGAPAYTPGGTASVDAKSVGYDTAWYARIAADAPEHYRVPDSVGALVNPELSTDRMRYI